MPADTRRANVYLNPTLAAAQARAKRADESFSGELTHAMQRYDAALAYALPDIPAAELTQIRRVLADKSRVPVAFATPKALAGLIESAADSQPPQALRVTHAAARRVAKLTPIECVALVEAVERWVRRADSQQSDRLHTEFMPAA